MQTTVDLSKVSTNDLLKELRIRKNSELAVKIHNLRTYKGLTLTEFGELFDPPANKSNVHQWERGANIPNPQRLKRINEMWKEEGL